MSAQHVAKAAAALIAASAIGTVAPSPAAAHESRSSAPFVEVLAGQDLNNNTSIADLCEPDFGCA
jgi:hypothetical protein